MKLSALLQVPALAPGVAFTMTSAQTPAPGNPSPGKLLSAVYDWTKLTPTPTATGFRRDGFDGPRDSREVVGTPDASR